MYHIDFAEVTFQGYYDVVRQEPFPVICREIMKEQYEVRLQYSYQLYNENGASATDR